MSVLGHVPVGDSPHEVVVSEDGKTAFVANYGAQMAGHTLSVIDLEKRIELRRVELLPLMRPHGIQVIGKRVYFSAESNRAFASYDPEADKIDFIMGTGQTASHMIVGNANETRFYTANIASNTITAFEFNSRPPAQNRIFQITVGNQPEAIDLSPDGKEVWIGLNVDKTIQIIDTDQKTVSATIDLGERPYRVRFSPDGKLVIATLTNRNEIAFIDAKSRKEIKRIKTESYPLGVIISKDSKLAYVTAVQNDCVLKIDLTEFKIMQKAVAGAGPDGVALTGI
ncbi:MAG: YncE family protein, partial [Calditrichaeota bacterium]|nr:YncE family protein [Calditrichota bacterium]